MSLYAKKTAGMSLYANQQKVMMPGSEKWLSSVPSTTFCNV
jgi:hypothetical protein